MSVRRRSFELDVSIELARGEVLAVLGPNGAGKSTLLGVLAGLLRPDEGRVRLGDRVLTDTAAGVHLPPHRRGVGLLAQQALLFPHLSALANVAFGPRAAGTPRRRAEQVAQELLDDVDAGELRHRRPSQLSGGQAQRVALARALAPRPDLLLLDEPLSALDVDVAPVMRSLLRRVVRDDKRTAVLVTHHVLDALVLADQVIVMSEGRIVEQGRTRDVLTRPRSSFAARIAGLNLLPGTACAEGVRITDGVVVSGSVGNVAAGEPAVAVFPPAAVAVFRDEPKGSPRNVVEVVLAAVEPHGEVLRLRAAADSARPWVDGLAADVTAAAVADLGAEPGSRLWFAVKSVEVAIHPVPRPVAL
jgi:molybdate transport system ATP-binding protein